MLISIVSTCTDAATSIDTGVCPQVGILVFVHMAVLLLSPILCFGMDKNKRRICLDGRYVTYISAIVSLLSFYAGQLPRTQPSPPFLEQNYKLLLGVYNLTISLPRLLLRDFTRRAACGFCLPPLKWAWPRTGRDPGVILTFKAFVFWNTHVPKTEETIHMG